MEQSGITKPNEIKRHDSIEVDVFGTVCAGNGDPISAGSGKDFVMASWINLKEISRYGTLRVQGKSMVGKGYEDGDLLIIKKRPEPHELDSGMVVVCTVAGKSYLREYRSDNHGRFVLVPGHPDYPIIVPDDDGVVIDAVVIGLYREQ